MEDSNTAPRTSEEQELLAEITTLSSTITTQIEYHLDVGNAKIKSESISDFLLIRNKLHECVEILDRVNNSKSAATKENSPIVIKPESPEPMIIDDAQDTPGSDDDTVDQDGHESDATDLCNADNDENDSSDTEEISSPPGITDKIISKPQGESSKRLPDAPCFKCEKSFKNPKSLVKHEMSHCIDLSGSIKCHKCENSFNDNEKYIIHALDHYGVRQTAISGPSRKDKKKRSFSKDFSCFDCEKSFKKPRCLIKHEKTHCLDSSGKIKCYKCKIIVTDDAEYFQHALDHLKNLINDDDVSTASSPQKMSRNSNFICSYCQKSCKGARFLAMHELTHLTIEKGVIPCEKCDETFTDQEAYIAHVTSHIQNDNNTVCKVCNLTFDSKKEMESHHRKNHNRNYQQVPCEICGKLVLYVGMKAHLMTHKPGGLDRKYICHVCGAVYKYKNGLNRHTRLHDETSFISCPEEGCPKKFNSMYLLKRHLIIHNKPSNEDMPFHCEYCGKGFLLKKNMLDHRDTHTGNKRYQCAICNAKFRQGTRLTNHMKIHTGVKPYSCTVCGKKHRMKESLNRHMYTHTEEKAFSCEKCGKLFKTACNARKHVKLVHDNPTLFPCKYCGRSFNRKYNTLAHERKCLEQAETPE